MENAAAYRLLADAVLLLHFSIVVFVVAGLPLIFEGPLGFFTLVYTVFGLLVAWTWWYFPPEKKSRRRFGARDGQESAVGRKP